MPNPKGVPKPIPDEEIGVKPGRNWWMACRHPAGYSEYAQVKQLTQFSPRDCKSFEKGHKYEISSTKWTANKILCNYKVYIGFVAETLEEVKACKRISWPVPDPRDSDDVGSASEVERIRSQAAREAPKVVAGRKRKAAEDDLSDLNAFIESGSLLQNKKTSATVANRTVSSSSSHLKNQQTNSVQNCNSVSESNPKTKKQSTSPAFQSVTKKLKTNQLKSKSKSSSQNNLFESKTSNSKTEINKSSDKTKNVSGQNNLFESKNPNSKTNRSKNVSDLKAVASSNHKMTPTEPSNSQPAVSSSHINVNDSLNSKITDPTSPPTCQDIIPNSELDSNDSQSNLSKSSNINSDSTRKSSEPGKDMHFHGGSNSEYAVTSICCNTVKSNVSLALDKSNLSRINTSAACSDPVSIPQSGSLLTSQDSGVESVDAQDHPASGPENSAEESSYIVLADGELQAENTSDTSVLQQILSTQRQSLSTLQQLSERMEKLESSTLPQLSERMEKLESSHKSRKFPPKFEKVARWLDDCRQFTQA